MGRGLDRLTSLAADFSVPDQETRFALSRVEDDLPLFHTDGACDPILLTKFTKGLEVLGVLFSNPGDTPLHQASIHSALTDITLSWDQLRASLDYRLLRSSRQLHQDQRAFAGRVIGAMLVWLGLMFAAWRWCWASVIRPVRRLAASARDATSQGIAFHPGHSGPMEIRQLAGIMDSLINDVDGIVQARTDKLKSQKQWLEARNLELADLVSQRRDQSQNATVLLGTTAQGTLLPLQQLLAELQALEQAEGLNETEQKTHLQRIRKSAETVAQLLADARAA